MANTPILANNMSSASPPADLKTLATGINDAIRSMTGHALHIVKSAMDAGDLLIKAKAAVVHGEWAQWLEVNCKLSDRTARRYMALAEGRGTIEAITQTEMATVANLTIRQAERLIAKPKAGAEAAIAAIAKPSGALSDIAGAKAGATNDPVQAVGPAQERLFTALSNLRRNDPAKAREAAETIIKKLKELDFV